VIAVRVGTVVLAASLLHPGHCIRDQAAPQVTRELLIVLRELGAVLGGLALLDGILIVTRLPVPNLVLPGIIGRRRHEEIE
jgi:hypothetical protein